MEEQQRKQNCSGIPLLINSRPGSATNSVNRIDGIAVDIRAREVLLLPVSTESEV